MSAKSTYLLSLLELLDWARAHGYIATARAVQILIIEETVP